MGGAIDSIALGLSDNLVQYVLSLGFTGRKEASWLLERVPTGRKNSKWQERG